MRSFAQNRDRCTYVRILHIYSENETDKFSKLKKCNTSSESEHL